ncbi:MAG: hypothetical protein DHS20C12_18670 [Pseudohongiella sp.]|nr:MAG: hypothetical protein DHS20C12_18670 [Pseudohongiella sp.]
MSERKTLPNNASVKDFIASVKNDQRRADAAIVTKMMAKASKKRAKMWGPSIIGFGEHHYQHANGKEVSICKIGFSPRATALTFYLGNFPERAKLLKKLGKHTLSGGGCLYIKKLEDVDADHLQTIMEKSYNIPSKAKR